MTQPVTIQLAPQQVDYILSVIAKQPWEAADPLIKNIVEQVRPQMQQQQPVEQLPTGQE